MAKKKPPKDYEVGYGKPPAATRFKPGQSGNRSGRPKGSKSFQAHVQTALNRRVKVTTGDKQRTMSKRAVIAEQVVNRAAGGDHKVIPLVAKFDHEQATAASSTNPHVDLWDTEEDRLLLARAKQRMRADESVEPDEDDDKDKGDSDVQFP